MGKKEIDKIFDKIEKERKKAIQEVKNSNMAEWEKKMTLKAIRSSV